MTTEVVTVRAETTVHEAARELAQHRISAMPVVDTAGFLIGVVSEADVVREALVGDQRAHLLMVPAQEGPAATRVREVMTSMPLAVRPGDDLAEAVQLMADAVVKSLPVVQDGRIVGVVSRSDVVQQLARFTDRSLRPS